MSITIYIRIHTNAFKLHTALNFLLQEAKALYDPGLVHDPLHPLSRGMVHANWTSCLRS